MRVQTCQHLVGRSRRLDHDDLVLARDADHRAWHLWGVASHDGAVRRRIVAGQRRCRRPRIDRDASLLGELHRLRVQHPGPRFGQLLRLLVRQRRDPARARHDARIGGVDAVDVRANFAVGGAERRRHRHGGRVAAAAAERRHFTPVRHALVACNDDDLPAGELVLDAERADFDDPGIDVAIVGDDPRLASREADGVAAELANGQRQERHRDALAGREQHVELTTVGVGRD